MNIVLIGMPGSGKSSFGRFIANLMNMPFIDTDEEICKKYGDISTIFSSGGEKVFREFEESEVCLASQKDNCVIATGGGVVTNKTAVRALKENGLLVYLYCDADFLLARLEKDDSRPLLLGENKREKIEELLRSRANLYLKYSDVVLNEGGILQSRNLLEEEEQIQLGALYLEFLNAFEKRVYS